MREMIRQGREALGTTYKIEGDGGGNVDEGFFDDSDGEGGGVGSVGYWR